MTKRKGREPASFRERAELGRARRAAEQAARSQPPAREEQAKASERGIWDLAPDLYELCRSHFGEPQVIPLRVWKNSRAEFCHDNVWNYVAQHGGSVQCGWRMHGNLYELMGEFHSVWRSLDGDLVDVTSRHPGHGDAPDTSVFVPLDVVLRRCVGGDVVFEDHPVLREFADESGYIQPKRVVYNRALAVDTMVKKIGMPQEAAEALLKITSNGGIVG